MWREGNRIFFESRVWMSHDLLSNVLHVRLSLQVPESNQTILTGGYVDLHSVVNNTSSPGSAQVGESVPSYRSCSRLTEHVDEVKERRCFFLVCQHTRRK